MLLFSCVLGSCKGASTSSPSSTSLDSSSSGSKDDSTGKYGLTLQYKSGFRILWLTDLHFGNPTNTSDYDEEKEYTHLRTMIEQANNPDLIVLTGDTFEKETTEQVDAFITFIDSFNIKWAFTYGNHDSSSLISDSYYINKKIMASKNAAFVDYENDDIYGLTNYYINLQSNNKNVYRLYIIDSNNYKLAGDGGDSIYDVIHQDQLDHLQKIYDNQGDKAPGLAFFHICLKEFVTAYQGYSDGIYQGQGYKKDPFGYGYKNNGVYNVMKNCGIVGAFAGHDHGNDFDINYFDETNHMVLSYGLKESDLNYYQTDMVGYKIITLPDNPSSFSYSDIKETKVNYAQLQEG